MAALPPKAKNDPLAETSSTSSIRLIALLFLTLAFALTWVHHEQFFGPPQFEEGDSAANALQIHRAKEFKELHGNYSRWQFHHPGPAFFYWYALGEWLLFDLTALTPAPRNAHLFAGMLLQLAFYAAAIALIARQSRQPMLVAALALSAGAAHLPQVERIIFSIWPPDVLLMPFLCFIVACASVARGDRHALPFLVFAGSFLVHGHVAQILFVGPLAAIALLLAWRAHRKGKRFTRATLATSLTLLAVFLLPIALDVLRGHRSNASEIWLHLRYYSESGQTLLQAALGYIGTFAGINDASIFNELTPAAYVALRSRAWAIALWLGMLVATLWLCHRQCDRHEGDRAIHLARALLWFWLGASGLTLIWGMRQDGGLTSFNSHFDHTLVHTIAFAFILAIAGRGIPRLPRGVPSVLMVAGVAAFAIRMPDDPSLTARGDEIAARLPAVLRADPQPGFAKLITFPPDDWYDAATVARALQRSGVKFYVDPEWRFMFGSDHVFRINPDAAALSEWKVVGTQSRPSGSHRLNRASAVIFPPVMRVESFPCRFEFAAGAPAPVSGIGMRPDREWAWTEGNAAALRFIAPHSAFDIEVRLDASGFVGALSAKGQRANIHVNGELLAREVFNELRRQVRIIVPPEVWNRHEVKTIALELPDAVSPAAAGMSGDRRWLGLRLFHVAISPVGM